MSLFSPPKRSRVSLWCGEIPFPLLDRGLFTATRTARIVTYVDDVHLWIDDMHYGKFARQQLGSWIRLRAGTPPESQHTFLTMDGFLVAVNLKIGDRGRFIGAIPGEVTDRLEIYL